MKLFGIVWKHLFFNFSSSVLGLLLSSLGTAIFCLVLWLSSEIGKKLDGNSKVIDLVIGAKGSPLQLILNSIYHIDYPTGNILLEDAQRVARHPLVELAVPLSMGDNYRGFRIVGTDSNFLSLYKIPLVTGRWISHDFEIVVGYEVAKTNALKIGDRIIGAHGLSASEDLHADHPYTVVGILEKNESAADKLLLTNLSSVWHMHEHDAHAHQDHSVRQQPVDKEEHMVHRLLNPSGPGRGITSMLIRYKNPTAVAMFPRFINQTTNMQAASPAIESARLFSILGIGLDALRMLAFIVMLMAALSVFVGLYNSFKNRKYELAIMRTMGASQSTLFTLIIMEGMLITLTGSAFGILLAHLGAFLMTFRAAINIFEPWHVGTVELSVVLTGLLLGFIAAFIPAAKAYSTSIAQTLSS